MKLKRMAQVGTLESNDIQIVIKPADKIQIKLESSVKDQFGDAILKVIKETLKENKIEGAQVMATDNGALDYAIKARMETAIRRAK